MSPAQQLSSLAASQRSIKKFLVLSSWLLVFFLLPLLNPVYAADKLQINQECQAANDQCDSGLKCQEAKVSTTSNVVVGQNYCFPDRCPDSYFTSETGSCIHKTGGYYTNDPEDPGYESRDPQTGCVYDFQPADANQCRDTNSATTSGQLVTGGNGANGTPIDNTNYKAPQHANYTLDNLEHGILCELAGMSPMGKCIGTKVVNGQPTSFLFNQIPGGGAVGGLTNITVALFTNPPTSTTQYLADLGKNFGLAKPAYAQSVGGSGASIISPVLSLWKVTRNLAYLAFILVFVAVGFMIMFRAKVSQQAVVSAQQALPGLIIGLILVWLSYFIAALLVDFSFVGIQLVAQIFDPKFVGPNVFGNNLSDLQNVANNSNAFELFMTPGRRIGENIGDIFSGGFSTIASSGSSYAVATVITTIIGAIIGGLVGPVGILVGAGLGATIGPAAGVTILSLIVPLILIIVLFIQFFRLLFQLINAYIAILVATVTGPLVILMSSIPGRGKSLELWWKTLLGNSLIFPAVFAAFLFGGLMLRTESGVWQVSPPLFGGLNPILLKLIIAYAIIIGTPAIPGMVKKAMGVPDIQGIPQEATAGALAGFSVASRFAPSAGRGLNNMAINKLENSGLGRGPNAWQNRLRKGLENVRDRTKPRTR